MILSNREIHKALDEGRLVITPEPQPRLPAVGENCPFDTHSVDLRLSPEISIPKEGAFAYDLTQQANQAEFMGRNSERLTLNQHSPYRLQNGVFILGRTIEKIELPLRAGDDRCLAARIEGKSSRARIGLLVHFTAPTVHPGFEGTLTLEMINLGPSPILLVPGMPIAQLIIEEVRGVPIENPSQFHGQTTPEGT